jgi:NADPH:quinone reductase-like Zn-dependent oxidoreductase
VGVAVLQLAALRGIHVIGTAAELLRAGAPLRRRPVAYGPGLFERVVAIAGDVPIVAALDAVGTDEAVDVSLALVADRGRIVTIVTPSRANADGFRWIAGALPASARFRDEARAGLIAAANAGTLAVPVARTFPLEDAPRRARAAGRGTSRGALALIP